MESARLRGIRPLIAILSDRSQPVSVREEAAESLAYYDSPRPIPALLAALGDISPEVRFWSVFALGSLRKRHPDPRIVPALQGLLSDDAVANGNWSVGREAAEMFRT